MAPTRVLALALAAAASIEEAALRVDQAVAGGLSPTDVERVICKYASQKIEAEAVEGACSAIARKLPDVKFDPDCKTALEGHWDKAVAMCSKSPADIGKLICELASRKAMEGNVVREVCTLIAQKFPGIEFNPNCTTLLESIWDAKLAAFCPSQASAHTQKSRSASDLVTVGEGPAHAIEKLVCKVAFVIADKGAEELCDLLDEDFPEAKPVCTAGIHFLMQEASRVCPSQASNQTQKSRSASDLVTVGEGPAHAIEKLVCKVAFVIVDKGAEELCDLLDEDFPEAKPVCTAGIHFLMQEASRVCPSQASNQTQKSRSASDLVTVGEGPAHAIEKLVCKVAFVIADKGAEELCDLLDEDFPEAKPVCTAGIHFLMQEASRVCPSQASAHKKKSQAAELATIQALAPGKSVIEELVCKFAFLIGGTAAKDVCIVFEELAPVCEIVVTFLLNEASHICPKEVAAPLQKSQAINELIV